MPPTDQDNTPVRNGSAPAGSNPGSGGQDLSGRTLGDFQVERLLGRGGMGEVYLARQISLDRPVALKVLKPELVANPTYLARFEKEALSAAKLSHPNIVHVYSFGEVGGLKCIAMEYVHGTNLKEFLAKKGIPDLNLALSIMRQAAQALAAAAEQGLVHRDIKPENLLLTRKAQVKVADFGLCRSSSTEGMQITQEGVTLGTPMYMSPEQVQGKDLDHRSDLYSLGVTFYHMLAGVPPFQADNPVALALKHVRDMPPSLALHRPDLPADLVKLVAKLLEKSPSDRYATAGELLKDLSRIRASLSNPALPTSSLTLESTAQDLPPAAKPSTQKPERPAFQPRKMAAQLGSFALGPWAMTLLILAGLLSGLVSGLRARTPNLLSGRSSRLAPTPGLWMADWEIVPAFDTPEAQFRYAQLQSPESERIAAWLAVPGRFRDDKKWADLAYTQLARTLFRYADHARLNSLAAELDLSRAGQDSSLAKVCRAAAAALLGDPEQALSPFNDMQVELLDPALNELGLEATDLALKKVSDPAGSLADRLTQLRNQLATSLQIEYLVRMGLIDTR